VSTTEIIDALPRLTEAERRLVLNRLRELAEQQQGSRLEEAASIYGSVDLESRGIGHAQAGDLRARLKTFAEDWDRPEASIYDEDPAR
jgi:hypothetical protein